MMDPLAFRVTIRLPTKLVTGLPTAAVAPGNSKLLVDEANQPVWPIENENDRALLSSAVEIFGSKIEPRAASEAKPSAPQAIGQVLGIGDVEAEARLYAHLTGRTWRVVKTVDELSRQPLPEVILIRTPRLDPDLIEFLFHAPDSEAKPGVLWGRNRSELASLVLMRSAASMLCGPVADRRIDVDCVSGANVDHDKIRETLARGAGVLTLVAHGDSYSTRLASRMVLCAMDRPAEHGDRTLAPACIATGVCEKVKMPVEEAVRRGNLLAPEGLAARVLLMASCLTAYVGSPALDSAWTHFARLVLNPRIGAVLASPESTIIVDSSISQDLSQELAEGVPVGRALTNYEGSPTVSEIGNRFLLFGDPRTRAAPGGQGRINTQRTGSHQAARMLRRDPADTTDPEIAVLRQLASHIRPDMRDVADQTSRRALQSLNAYESASGAARARAGEDMRSAILAHLATMKVQSQQAWLNASYVTRSQTLSRCPQCGMLLRVSAVRFASGYERNVVNCMRCYIVADLPASSQLEVKAELPRIEIRNPPVSDEWSAAAFLVPGVARDTTMHPWPRDEAGGPAAALEVKPSRWPTGPIWMRFVIIADTSLHVTGAPARSPLEPARL